MVKGIYCLTIDGGVFFKNISYGIPTREEVSCCIEDVKDVDLIQEDENA
jgi:hypothetical protein